MHPLILALFRRVGTLTDNPNVFLDGGPALSILGSRAVERCVILACMWTSIGMAVGCGDSSGKNLLPVVGKVTVNGQPLTTGTGSVSFRPEKGSANAQEPAGTINQDGMYHLITNGKEGAPTGRYHVLVTDMEPIDPKNSFPYGKRKSHVNPKYSDTKTSDLFIEVVQSPTPGAYDLKLSK
jgi:hypothetical protein